MQSKASTPEEYLKELPADRRRDIETVRKVILKNLPKGYEEGMGWGMIGYFVPLKLFPEGYGGKKDVPLPLLSLASQKNHMALYLMITYGNKDLNTWFRSKYAKTGKKLDMGKGCLRFKKAEDLPLELIGELISKVTVKDFIEQYKQVRGIKK